MSRKTYLLLVSMVVAATFAAVEGFAAQSNSFSLITTLQDDIKPTERTSHDIVFDGKRGILILFGGQSGDTFLNDTWEWDGTAWKLANESGPPARSSHELVYDNARGKTILFGGEDKNATVLGDTWVWDGTNWTLLSDSGPPARESHAMCFDGNRNKIVLFGGKGGDGNNFGDTWEWDGAGWKKVSDYGPTARRGHALAYDSVRRVVVLFGGEDKSVYLNDTWSWDGKGWKQLATSGPPERSDHEMAFDAARGKLVLFGGIGYFGIGEKSYKNRTWEWDGKDWAEVNVGGLPMHIFFAMDYDSVRKQVLLFGGMFFQRSGEQAGGFESVTISHSNEIWAWDGRQWTKQGQ